MKRQYRRLLSIFLSLTILCGLGQTAFAAAFADTNSSLAATLKRRIGRSMTIYFWTPSAAEIKSEINRQYTKYHFRYEPDFSNIR